MQNDLAVKPQDIVTIKYYIINNKRRLEETSNQFKIYSVTQINEKLYDKSLMPDYPGFKDAESCREWDPSIPIDLDKIRDKDEKYWDQFGGLPKVI